MFCCCFKKSFFFKNVCAGVIACFLATTLIPREALAQGAFNLPVPGTVVPLSPGFVPVMLRGLKVYPDNPFQFDFIVDSGNTGLQGDELKAESEMLARYFLATLTTPEEDLWVNLSPYESDRIIPEALGQTEMGQELLAQDYILKQVTASLMLPDSETGKEFWAKVYKKAYEEYGTTNIPVDTFNKVWIVPEKAVVYEDTDKALVTESHLKVMLESDYLAEQKSREEKVESREKKIEDGREVPILPAGPQSKRDKFAQADLMSADGLHKSGAHLKTQPLNTNDNIPNTVSSSTLLTSNISPLTSDISSSIVREVLIPLLEREVNEGKNFSELRQMFHAMVLATWYKTALKESILNKVYGDKKKIAGLKGEDRREKGEKSDKSKVISSKENPETLKTDNLQLTTPASSSPLLTSNVSPLTSNVEVIYQQYLAAYKKGVCNILKIEYDTYAKKHIPRKYFSGGFGNATGVPAISSCMTVKSIASAAKTIFTGIIIGTALFISVALNPASAQTPSQDNEDQIVLAQDQSQPLANTVASFKEGAAVKASPSLDGPPIKSGDSTVGETQADVDGPPVKDSIPAEVTLDQGYDYISNNLPSDLQAESKRTGKWIGDLEAVKMYPPRTYLINGDSITVYIIPIKGLTSSYVEYGSAGYVMCVDEALVENQEYLQQQQSVVQETVEAIRASDRIMFSVLGVFAASILGFLAWSLHGPTVRKLEKKLLDRLAQAKDVKIIVEGDDLIVQSNKDRVRINFQDGSSKMSPSGVGLRTQGKYETRDILGKLTEIVVANQDFKLTREKILALGQTKPSVYELGGFWAAAVGMSALRDPALLPEIVQLYAQQPDQGEESLTSIFTVVFQGDSSLFPQAYSEMLKIDSPPLHNAIVNAYYFQVGAYGKEKPLTLEDFKAFAKGVPALSRDARDHFNSLVRYPKNKFLIEQAFAELEQVDPMDFEAQLILAKAITLFVSNRGYYYDPMPTYENIHFVMNILARNDVKIDARSAFETVLSESIEQDYEIFDQIIEELDKEISADLRKSLENVLCQLAKDSRHDRITKKVCEIMLDKKSPDSFRGSLADSFVKKGYIGLEYDSQIFDFILDPGTSPVTRASMAELMNNSQYLPDATLQQKEEFIQYIQDPGIPDKARNALLKLFFNKLNYSNKIILTKNQIDMFSKYFSDLIYQLNNSAENIVADDVVSTLLAIYSHFPELSAKKLIFEIIDSLSKISTFELQAPFVNALLEEGIENNLNHRKSFYSQIFLSFIRELTDRKKISDSQGANIHLAEQLADELINKNLGFNQEIYNSIVQNLSEEFFTESMLRQVLTKHKFRIPGYRQDFMTLNKFSSRVIPSFESAYKTDPNQAQKFSFKSVSKIDNVETFLSQEGLSGNLAMHQINDNLDLVKAVLMSGYLLPANILKTLNDENAFDSLLKEGKVRSLIGTEFVHFSVNQAVTYKSASFAYVTPIEILLENKSFLLNPLLEKNDWPVGGFTARKDDSSHAIPLGSGVFLAPMSSKKVIQDLMHEIQTQYPQWKPPNKIYYYNGKTAAEGLKEMREMMEKTESVLISRMPKGFRDLGSSDGFKCDSVGRGAVKVLGINRVIDDLAEYQVQKYKAVPYLTRWQDVQRLSKALEEMTENLLEGSGITARSVMDSGSSIRGTYQEKFDGLSEDLDLMVYVDGDLPVNGQLSEFQIKYAKALEESEIFKELFSEKSRQYSVRPFTTDFRPEQGYSRITVGVFEGADQNNPVLSVDVVFYNIEKHNDGPRYAKKFVENMEYLLSGLSPGDQKAGEQFILSTIRTLKMLFKNDGVYKRYEGGLRGVGTEQIVMQMDAEDDRGTPRPAKSLREVQEKYSVESVLLKIRDMGFDEQGRFQDLEAARRKLKIIDIGAAIGESDNLMNSMTENGWVRLLGLALDFEDQTSDAASREEFFDSQAIQAGFNDPNSIVDEVETQASSGIINIDQRMDSYSRIDEEGHLAKLRQHWKDGTLSGFIEALKEVEGGALPYDQLSDRQKGALEIFKNEASRYPDLNVNPSSILFVPRSSWVNHLLDSGFHSRIEGYHLLLTDGNSTGLVDVVVTDSKNILRIIEIIIHENLHSLFDGFREAAAAKFFEMRRILEEAWVEKRSLEIQREIVQRNEDLFQKYFNTGMKYIYKREGLEGLFSSEIYQEERAFLNKISTIFSSYDDKKANAAVMEFLKKGDESLLESLLGDRWSIIKKMLSETETSPQEHLYPIKLKIINKIITGREDDAVRLQRVDEFINMMDAAEDEYDDFDLFLASQVSEDFQAFVKSSFEARQRLFSYYDNAMSTLLDALLSEGAFEMNDQVAQADLRVRLNAIILDLIRKGIKEEHFSALGYISDEASSLEEEAFLGITSVEDVKGFHGKKGSADTAFLVSHGLMPDEKFTFEKVDPEIGRQYQAHGIAKGSATDMMDGLLNLLNNGISSEKTFYTAPFEIRDEDRAGAGAGVGTASGTAYKDGVAVILAEKGADDFSNGIKYVLLNDAYLTQELVDQFNEAYKERGIVFALLSQQKALLEHEFTLAQYKQWYQDVGVHGHHLNPLELADSSMDQPNQADAGEMEPASVAPKEFLPDLPDEIVLDVAAPDGVDTGKAGTNSDFLKGGIDLNSANLELKRTGSSPIQFNLPPEWQGVDLENIPGFVPVITGIVPMNFGQFLTDSGVPRAEQYSKVGGLEAAPITSFNALLGFEEKEKLEVGS